MTGWLRYRDLVLCGTLGVDASNESSENSIGSNLLFLAVWICAVLEVLKRLICSKTSLFNLHKRLSRSIQIRDRTSLEYFNYSPKVLMICLICLKIPERVSWGLTHSCCGNQCDENDMTERVCEESKHSDTINIGKILGHTLPSTSGSAEDR